MISGVSRIGDGVQIGAADPNRKRRRNSSAATYRWQTTSLKSRSSTASKPRASTRCSTKALLPEALYAVAAKYLHPGSVILDAGCRDAAHLIRLVRDNGANGVGVDPVASHIERANAAIEAAALRDRIEVVEGVIQELAFPDDHFDFIWCRDVLELIDDLDVALKQTARVLKASGRMLVYAVFATERLDAREAAILSSSVVVESNLDQNHVEHAFERAGFRIDYIDTVGSEWREYDEEHEQPVSKALLRLSRLRRQRDAVVEDYGADTYEHVEAALHWLLYLLIGKLMPVIYVLHKAT
jgi:SAM-dependent methyltransferase